MNLRESFRLRWGPKSLGLGPWGAPDAVGGIFMQVRTRLASILSASLAGVLSVGLLTLAPPAVAAPGDLEFVGTSNTGGNRINHTVTIPAGVQAGDTLVAFITTNTTNTTINDLAGWTLLESADGNGVRGRAY